MAKEYFGKLTNLIHELNLVTEIDSPIEVNTFLVGLHYIWTVRYVSRDLRLDWCLNYQTPKSES